MAKESHSVILNRTLSLKCLDRIVMDIQNLIKKKMSLAAPMVHTKIIKPLTNIKMTSQVI